MIGGHEGARRECPHARALMHVTYSEAHSTHEQVHYTNEHANDQFWKTARRCWIDCNLQRPACSRWATQGCWGRRERPVASLPAPVHRLESAFATHEWNMNSSGRIRNTFATHILKSFYSEVILFITHSIHNSFYSELIGRLFGT